MPGPRRLARVLLVGALAACGADAPTAPDDLPPTLAVGGYVMVGSEPGQGIVGLVSPDRAVLAQIGFTDGRYQLGWPIEPGEVVCGRYRLLVVLSEDLGNRVRWVDLDESSGECVMPASDLTHRVVVVFDPNGSDLTG